MENYEAEQIAVLCVMPDSIYFEYPHLDCYDEKRDMMNFKGKNVIIAHPPCRLWSRMRYFSTAPASEKLLAIKCVQLIRENGGVLEHPESSTLWNELKLPKGLQRDQFGGFSIGISQKWFGHLAEKKTWLYIVGCEPSEIPPYPISLKPAQFTVSTPVNVCSSSRQKREIPKKLRSATPLAFAEWLIELARIIQVKRQKQ